MQVISEQGSKVGQVSRERYEQIVARARELVERMSAAQFAIGDLALEIEPMREPGGQERSPEAWGVSESLRMFAEDIGLSPSTVKSYRWVASRWPIEHRRQGVSHKVHSILADEPDQQRRFAMIADPERYQPSKRVRWTADGAKSAVGNKPETPFTVSEKVAAVADLTADENVAARVATTLLHRPDVAFRAMGDPTAKQLVNRAQVDHAVQAVERRQAEMPGLAGGRAGRLPAGDREPVAVPRMRRCLEFIDLIGACALFVSSVGKVMPTLRGHTFTDDEKDAINANVARVRATADWVEHAAQTGNLSLDEGLAALLREQ